MHGDRILEIRNPKHETRNKPEIPIPKCSRQAFDLGKSVFFGGFRRGHLNLFFLNLVRVSNLGFC
jgi:hypothetical protein